MAISFACPGCTTPFRVMEDMAGKRVKCPKCLMVFTLPAPAPPPVPEPAAATSAPAAARKAASPIDDLFREADRRDPDHKGSRQTVRDDDRDGDRDRSRDQDDPRPRRTKARRSKGSALPWVLGLGAAAVVLFLVCGGGIAIIAFVAFRGNDKKAPIAGKVAEPKVQMVQGQGARVALANGVFQTNDQLIVTDPADPKDIRFRCKLYQIDLQAGRNYVIDMESTAFDAYLRLEDANGRPLMEDDDSGGNLNARMHFTPNQTGTYVVIATTFNENTFGAFTLTVRESNLPKPGGNLPKQGGNLPKQGGKAGFKK